MQMNDRHAVQSISRPPAVELFHEEQSSEVYEKKEGPLLGIKSPERPRSIDST
jgi:hypothetical protein